MRIGFVLGTFDPIHISHILLSSTVLNLNLVDKVYYVPTVQNPWKMEHPIADFDTRCLMIKKSIEPINKKFDNKVKVEKVENSLMPPYYSYKTLDVLAEKYKYQKNDLYIIAGADVINTITDWLNFESSIKDKYQFIAFGREQETITNKKINYTLVKVDLPPISSTKVREILSDSLCAYPYISAEIVQMCEKIYKNCNNFSI